MSAGTTRARLVSPRSGARAVGPSGPIHEFRRTVAPVVPGAFFELATAAPRGFWATGDRWVAHAGLAGSVAFAGERPGPPPPSPNGVPGPAKSRVEVVRDGGERLFARIESGGAQRSPRLFGGMSFSPDRSADAVWEAFPPALFHLPEVELEHHPAEGACTLAARGATRTEAERSWRRWADALEQARDAGDDGWDARAEAGDQGRAVPGELRLGADRAGWTGMVNRVLKRIGRGEAEKVVLARTLDVIPRAPLDPARVALALWRENHGSYVFLFEPAPGSAVVGAAPETIATLSRGRVWATAVAGSTGVGGDSVETAQLAGDLFASAKDRAEHDLVVRYVVDRLRALGCAVRRDVEPHVLALARIQHLETKIAGPAPPDASILSILASVHPTPAVCGTPREVAMAVIAGDEDFDRGWYAGPVGWCDAAGEGIFVPALRSAVRFADRWRLFAGAGIVAGSEPEAEWDETELKFRPVLRALARVG